MSLSVVCPPFPSKIKEKEINASSKDSVVKGNRNQAGVDG